jgi:AAHS family 4-hydroxybenzoate transporter-like MFS transporter
VTRTVDVAALLDGSAWGTYQKLLTLLAALTVIFDGFDIQILGFAIPSLIREWHLARSDFAPVLAIGLAAMALGTPLAGYCGDRFGRRSALIGCVAIFGLATVATAFVHGLAGLAILRCVTGMGTGGALPNATALTAEFAPLRRRPVAVKLTIVCVPLGGMLGGLMAARVLPAFGWRALYVIGGAAPLLFALVLWWALPESPRFLVRRPAMWPRLGRLLTRMGTTCRPAPPLKTGRSAAARTTPPCACCSYLDSRAIRWDFGSRSFSAWDPFTWCLDGSPPCWPRTVSISPPPVPAWLSTISAACSASCCGPC